MYSANKQRIAAFNKQDDDTMCFSEVTFDLQTKSGVEDLCRESEGRVPVYL